MSCDSHFSNIYITIIIASYFMALKHSPDSLDNDKLYQAWHLSVKCAWGYRCMFFIAKTITYIRGRQFVAPGSSPHHLFLWWNTNTFIHLSMVCFHTTRGELSSCDRGCRLLSDFLQKKICWLLTFIVIPSIIEPMSTKNHIPEFMNKKSRCPFQLSTPT